MVQTIKRPPVAYLAIISITLSAANESRPEVGSAAFLVCTNVRQGYVTWVDGRTCTGRRDGRTVEEEDGGVGDGRADDGEATLLAVGEALDGNPARQDAADARGELVLQARLLFLRI